MDTKCGEPHGVSHAPVIRPRMRIVVLVGTAHKFQRPINGPHAEGIDKFCHTVRALCHRHKVRAIAEEMSFHALEEKGVTESVAQQLCAELNLCHQFSDPSPEERSKLGIRQDNDIRAEHMFDGWTHEQIEADVLTRGRAASDRIREQYWLRRIQELDIWPLLFICGACHFTPFATLLRESSLSVVEAHQDWEPEAVPGVGQNELRR